MRGELWAVDFEPQSQREEPGNTGRFALLLQTDALNRAGHASTSSSRAPASSGRLRTRAVPAARALARGPHTGLHQNTDLLIDQVRAVCNRRLLRRLGAADAPTLEHAEQALRWLTGA